MLRYTHVFAHIVSVEQERLEAEKVDEVCHVVSAHTDRIPKSNTLRTKLRLSGRMRAHVLRQRVNTQVCGRVKVPYIMKKIVAPIIAGKR